MPVLMFRHQAALTTNTRWRNASAVECLVEFGVSLSIYLFPRARSRVRELIGGDSYNRTILVMKLAYLPADAALHVGMIPWEA